MAKPIGIDLGTTNSVAAFKRADIEILLNRENLDLTRSVVGWYKSKTGDGQILVGSPAVDRMITAPKDTIISIKRLMGRAYVDPEVQKMREHCLYEIESPVDGTDADLRVVMGGKRYSPIEISSMILKKIKEDSEARLNDKVEQAVITVPAYFTDKQRDATRKAGWLAGLKVQKVLSEPTAAAIAYGTNNIGPDETKNILIYDLGGGTFDVSILTVAGGVFAELGIAGDMWLGGDDFDQMIIGYVIKKTEEEYGIDFEKIDEAKRLRFKIALKTEAEKAKKSLSSTTKTAIVLMGILEDEEKNLIDVEVELTREQFEKMIEDKVRASVDIVNKAIENAHIGKEQIDNVILVGGSSSIPMVQRALADIFGEDKVLKNVDPMKCVAQGAGILAAMLNEIECPSCNTPNPTDKDKCIKCGESLISAGIVHAGVTGMPYGIQTIGDRFDVIIPQGSAYPSPKPFIEPYETPTSNMRRIKVPVYAGFDEIASKNERQGIVWLPLPEKVPAGTRVDVAFSLDENAVLKVKVSLKDGSGREKEVDIEHEEGARRDKIEKMIDEASEEFHKKCGKADVNTQEEIERLYNNAINALDANSLDNAEKMSKELMGKINNIGKEDSYPEWKRIAEGLMGYSEFLIREYGSMMDPQKTYKIEKIMEELKEAMNKENQNLAEQKSKELDQELETLPGFIKDLMEITRAIGFANRKGDIKGADKARNMLFEIINALKKNDTDTANRLLDEIVPVVKEIYASSGEDVSEVKTIEELLKRKKSHSSSEDFKV